MCLTRKCPLTEAKRPRLTEISFLQRSPNGTAHIWRGEPCFSFSIYPTFPDDHKCRRIHGHTCEVTISIRVDDGPEGYAFDHARLNDVARDVIGPLDHQLINDIPGLERGLAEDQVGWLVDRFARGLADLGGELVQLHHDEWSSGGVLRLVKHRKSWP